jgi:far upstream element-binding protein
MADQNVAALLAALSKHSLTPRVFVFAVAFALSAVVMFLTSCSAGGAQQQRGAPQLPQGFAGLTSALTAATGQQPPQPVNSPPAGFSLPQPTASGSLDLSKIKPTASGRVSLDDALAKVKAKAAEMGVHRDASGGGRT